MTNREFWLKLFSENDVALIAAINLLQRYAPNERKLLDDSQLEHIRERKQWLNEQAPDDLVEDIFIKNGIWND